jgi:hypothetical protein
VAENLPRRWKPFVSVCIYCATSASELDPWVLHRGNKFTPRHPLLLPVKPGLCIEGRKNRDQRTIGFFTIPGAYSRDLSRKSDVGRTEDKPIFTLPWII